MLAVVEPGVFDHLSVPRLAEAVAQSIDGHAGNTTFLLDGLTRGSTKLEEMVLAWMGWGMMGRDMAFEQGDIASSMLRVGFKSVRGRTLDAPMGPMDLEIARKAETGSGTSTS
jgi:hypothetical protein